jgi:hypothetical protein
MTLIVGLLILSLWFYPWSLSVYSKSNSLFEFSMRVPKYVNVTIFVKPVFCFCNLFMVAWWPRLLLESDIENGMYITGWPRRLTARTASVGYYSTAFHACTILIHIFVSVAGRETDRQCSWHVSYLLYICFKRQALWRSRRVNFRRGDCPLTRLLCGYLTMNV